METIIDSRKELTLKNITYYGTGGHDMDGEWNWSGSYYAYFSKRHYNLNHNYHIQYNRGYKNNKWHIYIHLCLNCCNSDEFMIYKDTLPSLGAAKHKALDILLEWDSSNKFIEEIMPKLLANQKPVFMLKNNELSLFSTTYKSMCYDADINNWNNDDIEVWRYYHDNFKGYRNIYADKFYQLEVDGTMSHLEVRSGCRVSGGVRKEESDPLLSKMYELIKDDNRFTHYFNILKK